MKIFRPLSWLYRIYFLLLFFGSLLLLYPAFYYFLNKESRHNYAFKLKRFWAYVLSLGSFAPLVVKRKYKSLPEPPYIICANHTSFIDIIYMYIMFPDLFLFMGKKELLKWPLFGVFFRKMDIAVNRRNPKEALRALEQVSREIEKGKSFALFPEGTIPTTVPKMKPFKNGAFNLAIKHQIPIVPVTFKNNYKILEEALWGKARPGIARAVIHEPVNVKGMTEQDLVTLRTQIFQLINAELDEH